MHRAKTAAAIIYHTTRLVFGLIFYVFTKKTKTYAYESLITLFCLTQGYSNDILAKFICLIKRTYRFSNPTGLLGNLNSKELRNKIFSALQDQGYYIFAERLSAELCDKLLQYASTHPCKMRPMDNSQSSLPIKVAHYPRGEPLSVRYDFDTQDLLNNHDIQGILADLSFSVVAQDYLGAKPVLDVLGMWWHTDYSDKPDMEAAQYFHFDMDRPKWLKFFIYLTDVESCNGPHAFVSGTHQSGQIPSSLLKKGYARLTDEEIKTRYSAERVYEFAAPRGTIIAEDTRGLHKGKHVEHGDRLILQLQFSNCLFGSDYPESKLPATLAVELQNNINKYPDIYSAYSSQVNA